MKKKNIWKQVTAVTLALGLGLSSSMISFAEEGRTDRWEKDDWGGWKVRTEDGSGYLTDCWFQDIDGSWYLIEGDTTYSGVATDNNYYYFFDVGENGKMQTVDGTDNLTFNHEHNGHYGSIISGLNDFEGGLYLIEKDLPVYSLYDSSLNTLDTTPQISNGQTSGGQATNNEQPTDTGSQSLMDEWDKQVNWGSGDWNGASTESDFGKWK